MNYIVGFLTVLYRILALLLGLPFKFLTDTIDVIDAILQELHPEEYIEEEEYMEEPQQEEEPKKKKKEHHIGFKQQEEEDK